LTSELEKEQIRGTFATAVMLILFMILLQQPNTVFPKDFELYFPIMNMTRMPPQWKLVSSGYIIPFTGIAALYGVLWLIYAFCMAVLYSDYALGRLRHQIYAFCMAVLYSDYPPGRLLKKLKPLFQIRRSTAHRKRKTVQLDIENRKSKTVQILQIVADISFFLGIAIVAVLILMYFLWVFLRVFGLVR
jgi:hypothetical protein